MNEKDIQQLRQLIDRGSRFVLTCHTNPDGDALGSTLGLRQILRNMGKEATVVTPDLAPGFYSWMPDFRTVRCYERETEVCAKLIDEADAVFVMDYNELSRVKSLGEKIAQTQKTTVLIDHHTAPQLSCSLNFSFPEAPATCEVVAKLATAMGLDDKVCARAATNLYAGIITDTGGLSYNSSDPEIYLTVAALLRKGIDKTYVHDRIFNNKTYKRMKLLGYCLHRKMRCVEKLPIALMALDAEELKSYNYNTGDTEGFVNFPLQVKNITVSVLMLDRPDAIKISLRSKGAFPVNEFAAKYYGGGGHLNAAGASVKGDFKAEVDRFCQNIVEFYTKWAIEKH